jgi:hypothetical protein
MGRTAFTDLQCLYSRAILLLPLWAVRPVQNHSACTRVHFTFTFTFMFGLVFPKDRFPVCSVQYSCSPTFYPHIPLVQFDIILPSVSRSFLHSCALPSGSFLVPMHHPFLTNYQSHYNLPIRGLSGKCPNVENSPPFLWPSGARQVLPYSNEFDELRRENRISRSCLVIVLCVFMWSHVWRVWRFSGDKEMNVFHEQRICVKHVNNFRFSAGEL